MAAVYRKGFGHKKAIKKDVDANFHSPLVAQLIANNYEWRQDSMSIYLAKDFGFCYGVERAIHFVYETRFEFPDRRIYLIGEIVHNPFVNDQLKQLNIEIIQGVDQDKLDFSFIHSKDVVIIPAFGVANSTMKKLQKTGCSIVDATCGSVLSVWKQVEQYAKTGFTVVIHGKYPHEETLAICSQITKYPGGKYVVIRNKEEAGLICDFVQQKISAKNLLNKLGHKSSPDLDPVVDLERIGLANQTTMLGTESLEIANEIEKAMIHRYGEEELPNHFQNFDTVCGATQDRQDALWVLIHKHNLDLLLVIGGYHSSNTGNLVRIASRHVNTYHIQDEHSLLDSQRIRHKLPQNKEPVISSNWLPQKQVHIGVSAGASTPNIKIEKVLQRLFELVN